MCCHDEAAKIQLLTGRVVCTTHITKATTENRTVSLGNVFSLWCVLMIVVLFVCVHRSVIYFWALCSIVCLCS